jgi:hypothetical protein
MIRNLKTLGIAFAAVFAVTAVAASAAQAQVDDVDLTAAANPAYITVEADPSEPAQVFTTAVGSVSCEEFTGESGELSGEEGSTEFTELTLTKIAYSGNCELAGNEAEVDFDGCHYTISNGKLDTGTGKLTSDVALTPTGETCSVTITVPVTGCEVTVEGDQTFKGALTYTEVETGTKKEQTIHANTDKIAYTVKCPGFEEEFEGGSYEGTLTAKAYSDASHTKQVDLKTVVT